MADVILPLFPLLMISAAISDLLTLTISNRLSLAVAVGFLLAAALSGLGASATLLHLAAGFLVLVIGFGLFSAGWIGGGDAKLAAATTLWLGFPALLDYLILAAMAGGVLTLVILAGRALPLPAFALRWGWLARLHNPKTGVPYGVALAAAALAVYPHSTLWLSAAVG